MNLKKSTYSLILFCLLISIQNSVFSQNLENSLLWKISGKGLEKPSYIFGTLHATCEVKFSIQVDKALQDTEQLYLELDLDDPTLQAQMMSNMMMNNNEKISNLISADDYKLLDSFIQENTGVSLAMFDAMKPFILNSMLLPNMLDCPFKSVEGELIAITNKQNESVFGLETVTQQLAVFDKIPYKVQLNDLLKMAKTKMVNDKAELKKLIELYNKQDLEALVKLSNESQNEVSSKFQKELLEERNNNWIPIIEKVIKEKPTFFGVGALHLPGKFGVIELLRQKGYIVEPVY